MSALLNIEDLTLSVTAPVATDLLHGISLSVDRGETVGIVGESGSGKSLTARAALGLLPSRSVTSGSIRVNDFEVLDATPRSLRALRRTDVSMVFQDPRSSMNPVRRIGDYLTESVLLEKGWSKNRAKSRALALLDEVGLPDPQKHYEQFPHELSGGMLQRVMIAGALMIEPSLLICDEPTSALDVLSQAEVIRILQREQQQREMGMLFITHDLDLAATMCDRILVMTGGRIVEAGSAAQVLTAPEDAYTVKLLDARPGSFRFRTGAASEPKPGAPSDGVPALRVEHLSKSYETRSGTFTAVDDVSFTVDRGQSIAIVGESGSGKSTTARILVGLEDQDSGEVITPGEEACVGNRRSARLERARRAQIVFQDPYSSLDPRRTIRQSIELILKLHGTGSSRQRAERSAELLAQVGLEVRHGEAQPRSLSGGQRQRAAIARALAVDPRVLVLDEATSALDVSIQAQVLRLIDSIRRDTGLALVFVSHDLNLISSIAGHALVMKQGRVVEEGDPQRLLRDPQHPYTRQLVDAIPTPPVGSGDVRTADTSAI